MAVPKALRRAAREGGNIGESPGGDPLVAYAKNYVAPTAADAAEAISDEIEPPAKVSAPDAEGLLGTLQSLVKQHGIGEVLKRLGEIT